MPATTIVVPPLTRYWQCGTRPYTAIVRDSHEVSLLVVAHVHACSIGGAEVTARRGAVKYLFPDCRHISTQAASLEVVAVFEGHRPNLLY